MDEIIQDYNGKDWWFNAKEYSTDLKISWPLGDGGTVYSWEEAIELGIVEEVANVT